MVTYSSFLFLTTLNLYCISINIDILYNLNRINIVYFLHKKIYILRNRENLKLYLIEKFFQQKGEGKNKALRSKEEQIKTAISTLNKRINKW